MKLIWLATIGIFLAPAALHPELLVIKKENGRFAPLTEADLPDSQKIMDIILKYEWPMCIASDLTPEEQDALLTPNKPFAEEHFIRRKIQDSVGKQYEVVFVPTTIYELFCLLQWAKSLNRPLASPFDKVVAPLLTVRKPIISLSQALANTNPTTARKEVFDVYKKANGLFFNDKENNVAFYINCALGTSLFTEYPELAKSSNALISGIIKNKAPTLAAQWKSHILDELEKQGSNLSPYFWVATNILLKGRQSIINKIIHLDYEARELNKGLLLRATSFEKLQVGFGQQPKEALLAGSTVRKQYGFEKAYKEKLLDPYSVSLGNSLFAGILRDKTANIYSYLTYRPGYALFVDKKAYIEHQNNNLFFIAPVAPIVGLFLRGEYFHSRVKTAMSLTDRNTSSGYYIKHLPEKFIDPTGVLLITRDPLRQAELFSKFLAENGRIIQTGDSTDLTEQEKDFEKQIMQSQQEAAHFYKATRTMKSAIDRAAEKFRQRKAQESLMQE